MGAGCCVLTGDGSSRISHGPTLVLPPTGPGRDAQANVGGGTIVAAGEAGTPGTAKTPLQAALDASPLAIRWATAARTNLTALKSYLTSTPFPNKSNGNFAIANVHFHLDRDWDHVEDNLTKLVAVFDRILTMLRNTGKYYREGPMVTLGKVESWWADAPMGGFHVPGSTFTFRPKYPDTGPKCRSAILLHEGAHFCGQVNEITHFAYEFPAPDGKAHDGLKRNYKELLTGEAMRNASSYAAFAIHAATGKDERFGLDKKKL